MKIRDVLHHGRSYIASWVAFGLIASSMAYALPPESWKDAAYAYTAEKQSLYVVLENFGRAYGVRTSIDARLRKVMVDSKLSASSAMEYLDRLGVQYSFTWFFYNGVLYVSPVSDYVTERVQLPDSGIGGAEKALRGVGLLDPKFGWGELDGDDRVLVSGPSAYVRLVRELLGRKTDGTSDRESDVMVFRLKNALAADRQTTLRDQTQTIQGVATILRNILAGRSFERDAHAAGAGSGDSGRGASVSSVPTLPPLPGLSVADSLKDTGSSLAIVPKHEVLVDADARTNSVLVRDSSAKRDMYADLIAQLDIQTIPVEITATIVDIDENHANEWAPELLFGTTNHGVGISTSTTTTATDLLSGVTNANIALWAANKLVPRLRALESSGHAKVYARPSVMTMDNVDAVLDLSQTEYLKLIGERAVDVRSISTGTMLRVTPRVQGDGRIHAYIEVEDGDIKSPGSSTSDPQISRNTITTEAVLKENQALVIGGYKVQKRNLDHSGVPLLSRIPLLGKLFQSDTSSTSTSDRIFIISARAIRSEDMAEQADTAASWAAAAQGDIPPVRP